MIIFSFLTIFIFNGFVYGQTSGGNGSPCADPDTVLNPCGSDCDRTCDNINDPNWNCTACSLDTPSCSCKSGLVRNSGGFCVLPKDCSKVCLSGEAYSNCGNNECQDTCQDIVKSFECVGSCVPGCICIPGFVRDHNKGCINVTRCDVSCNGDPNAYPGIAPCGIKRTCSNINDEREPCTESLKKVCLCKNGYAEYKNTCVQNCPKCDKPNESFLCRSCGDITCDNLENSNKDCYNKPCVEGCFCNLGYARDTDGKCIRTDKCPQKSCKGDPNAIFEQCDIACYNECTNEKFDNCHFCCERLGNCTCRPSYNFVGSVCKLIKV